LIKVNPGPDFGKFYYIRDQSIFLTKLFHMRRFQFLILAVFFFVAACGNDDGEGNDNDSTNIGTDEVTVTKLTPDNIDLNKPFKPKELQDAVFAWKNVSTVTVTGYCDFFFDNGKIGTSVDLVENAGDKINMGDPDAQSMKCEMKQEYPEEFAKTTPVTIKGDIELKYGRSFVMNNAELINKGETIENQGYIDAESYKGENISLSDFYASYFGWMNKEITVEGYYQSSTTSTTSYGETTRVDLVSDNVTVGCRLAEGVTVPEDLANNRDGVIMKGIVKGEAFGNVVLEECTFVNR